MADTPQKTSLEIKGSPENDEIPPDTDIKNQYKVASAVNAISQQTNNQEAQEEQIAQEGQEEEQMQEQEEVEEVEEVEEEEEQVQEEQEQEEEQVQEQEEQVQEYEATQDIQGQEYQISQEGQNFQTQNLHPLESYEIHQGNEQYQISLPTQSYQTVSQSQGYQTYQVGQPYQVSQNQQIYNISSPTQNYQYSQTETKQTYQVVQPQVIQNRQNQQFAQLNQRNQTVQGFQGAQQMQTQDYQMGVRSKFKRGKYDINQNIINQNIVNRNIGKNFEPRDSNSKMNFERIQSRNNANLRRQNYTARYKSRSLFPNIPLISFEDIYTKKINLKSNIDIDRDNLAEYIEIPKEEYQLHANKDTLFLEGGMNTGRYKFRGESTLISEEELPGRVQISEEEILREIEKRTKKKEKKIKYEVLDKFYAITEFQRRNIKEKEFTGYEIENEKQSSYRGNKNINFQVQLGDIKSQSKISSQAQLGDIKSQSKISSQIQSGGLQSNAQSQYQFQSQVGGLNTENKSQSQSQTQLKSQSKGGMDMQMKMQASGSHSSLQNKNINYGKNIDLKTGKIISPIDNYSKYLLEQINKIRIDPQSFIGMIEDAKANIIRHKYGGYAYNGKVKIALSEGIPAFDAAIEFLKNTEAMEILEFSSDITVDLPRSLDELKNPNDLRIKVENLVSQGYSIRSYWKDIIKDPEVSFLLMIVDDHGPRRGGKRKDILNPKIKYIGISSTEINGHFVCYLTLGPAN